MLFLTISAHYMRYQLVVSYLIFDITLSQNKICHRCQKFLGCSLLRIPHAVDKWAAVLKNGLQLNTESLFYFFAPYISLQQFPLFLSEMNCSSMPNLDFLPSRFFLSSFFLSSVLLPSLIHVSIFPFFTHFIYAHLKLVIHSYYNSYYSRHSFCQFI